MCTASWFFTAEGFELLFNRDESRTRRPAAPPRAEVCDGVEYLAPVDGDAGGTWIAVNAHGLALGLLNAWQHVGDPPEAGFRSRGALVRRVAGARDAVDLARRLETESLADYPGFVLLALTPGTAPRSFAWDGERLADGAVEPPLCSSSRDPEGALRERRRALARRADANAGRVDRAVLFDFHKSQEPEPGPWAVCMRREDASTVSATHVVVGSRAVTMAYAPGPPDVTPFGAALRLARR